MRVVNGTPFYESDAEYNAELERASKRWKRPGGVRLKSARDVF
jgi:hypothetical protein